MKNVGTWVRGYMGTVSRREFFASMSAFGAFSILGRPSMSSDHLPTYPPTHLPTDPQTHPHGYSPGIQLYTLRALLEKDTEGTLAALAKMGYTEVELAGTYGKTPAAFRAILDRVGLKAVSGHCGIPDVTTGLEKTIADAKTLGQKYVVVASLPDDMHSTAGYQKAALQMNAAAVRLKREGLHLGYHNHDIEFAPIDGPRHGYDILLAETDPKLVVFELDLFWIRKARGDALATFKQHKGRFRLVHIKDMAADGAMVDVGQGAMDWATLLKAAKKAGVTEFFVEHDEVKDGLAFAKSAFDVISRLPA
jgi:sugar phosphate isomerase/epimerase